MTAATDSRDYNGLGTGLPRDEVQVAWQGPIAANVNLPSGSLAGALLSDTNTSPVIYPFVGDGTMRCLGFVRVGFNNTGGIQGARPIAVTAQTGKLVDANAGGGSAILQTDIFKPAYGVDNQTVSKLAAGGPCIGMLLGLDSDGLPVVLADPYVAALLIASDSGPMNDLIFDTATTLTIASGAVTVTQSAHAIDTEGGAGSDDLDTISSGSAEQVLFLRPASGARTVVIRNNGGGTGNIRTPGVASISMADATDFAILYKVGSTWTVIAASTLAVSAYTQTYSTASRTVANPTAVAVTDSTGGSTADTTLAAVTAPTALTDNTGGVAATTLAAITNAANAGSADVAPVANALAQFAASQAQNRAAIVALTNAVAKLAVIANANAADDLNARQVLTALIDDLQAKVNIG